MAFLRCPATSTTALNFRLFLAAERSCLVKSFRASGCFEESSVKGAVLERPCVHLGCLWGAGVLMLLPEPPLSPGEDSDCWRGQGLEPQLLGTLIGPRGTWVLFHSPASSYGSDCVVWRGGDARVVPGCPGPGGST